MYNIMYGRKVIAQKQEMRYTLCRSCSDVSLDLVRD